MNDEAKKNSKYKYQRKWSNYLIYPRYQLSLILMNLFIFIGTLSIVYYQSYKSFTLIHGLASKIDLDPSSTYFKLVGIQKELVFEAIFSSMLLGSILVFIFTLLFSHKSAGAVYRLKTYFKDIADNGYSKELGFREGDMHDDLPGIVNAGIERIKKDTIDEANK